MYLPPQGIASLAEHVRFRGPALPTTRLFARQDGSSRGRTEANFAHHVHAAWQRARRAAEPHFYDLRHAGLTPAAQSEATLAEVMRRAGHSSSRAAMIDQHAAERRDAEVAERLGRLAAGTKPRGTGT